MNLEAVAAQPPKRPELTLVPKEEDGSNPDGAKQPSVFDNAFDTDLPPLEVTEVPEDQFHAEMARMRAAESAAHPVKPLYDGAPPKIDQKVAVPELTLEPEFIPLANPDGGVRRPAKKEALTDEAWDRFKAQAGQPVKRGLPEDFVDSTRDLSQAEVQEIFEMPPVGGTGELTPEQKIKAEQILRQQEDLGLRLSAEIGELQKVMEQEPDPLKKSDLAEQIRLKKSRLDQIHRFLSKAESPML